MKTTVALLTAILAALTPGLGAAETVVKGPAPVLDENGTPQRPSIIMRPQWVKQPSREDMERVVRLTRGPGRALVRCRLKPDGRLFDCVVESESPEGLGIGAAALRLASKYRLKMIRIEGYPPPEVIKYGFAVE